MRVHELDHERRHSFARNDDRSSTGAMVLLALAVVLGVLFCYRRQHDEEHVRSFHSATEEPLGIRRAVTHVTQVYPPMAYSSMGSPMGKPVMGFPANNGSQMYPMHPVHMPGYCSGGGGYSGMAVAGSAAAGFLGGMLVSDVLEAGSQGSCSL